jgi:translocator protein
MDRQWLALVPWLLACYAAAAIGGVASAGAPEFFRALDRPAWAPPSWLFGPVWTLLYTLMAVAAWMVWRSAGWTGAGGALSLFAAQLVLNAAWSWIFFVRRSGALAFAEIIVLLAVIIATTIAFARIRPAAAWLMVPYIAWVTFASALTLSLWRRNPTLL